MFPSFRNFILLSSCLSALAAPLEPPSGVLFGAWLDTSPGRGDSPLLFNKRLGQNASLFQMALDIPLNQSALPPTHFVDETNTDAILYLTVYPQKLPTFTPTGNEVYQVLAPDQVVNDFAKQIADWVKNGRRTLIRLAPEMNGGWNAYGQRPVQYINLWRRVVTAVRNAVAQYPNSVAFIWSPNIGSGYPFPNGGFNPFTAQPYSAANAVDAAEFAALDTNKDGVLDNKDDPYLPYWPGTEYVDWVGISIYYYGLTFPWQENAIPPAGFFQASIEGQFNGVQGSLQGVNFYQTYSGATSQFKKPMIISETGAAFHTYLIANNAPVPAGAGNLPVKQAFWRQFMTNATFLAAHPNLKGICLFEFEKAEETTWRDFRITNDTNILSAFVQDINQPDIRNLYVFANRTEKKIVTDPKNGGQTSPGGTAGTSASAAVQLGRNVGMVVMLAILGALFTTL
ncbi:uncharacterized protein SPPG_07664 [Spizellomyces punctatus DAOM BR117]|uniref:GH26 domain-containing protein n=1 Tax=Spizellomyces punctatus (strain DAOM BR117) TaxID=645134 RepID=A0A0L0H5P2_SPIPD|nr:uncharacterized protein SPPG_07664 [Spizellomyces punctatus DAOM BR117]KNC96830.1 hypothetical protein SPPG_07664 [Spizellomyces punctatus DAOM BR117]|eukprot:XP_016604870.1 hypothetical protein SPPG_07664 [Spizellomyces punctatus DAOM BR117]